MISAALLLLGLCTILSAAGISGPTAVNGGQHAPAPSTIGRIKGKADAQIDSSPTLNDAIRVALRRVQISFVFAYDPADRTAVQPLSASGDARELLQALLKQGRPGWQYEVTETDGLIVVIPPPEASLPGLPERLLRFDVNVRSRAVPNVIRATMRALKRNWTRQEGLGSPVTLRGQGIQADTLLRSIVRAYPAPILYSIESDVVNWRLGTDVAWIGDQYIRARTDRFDVTPLTVEEQDRIKLRFWSGRRPPSDSAEGRPAPYFGADRRVHVAPGTTGLMDALTGLLEAADSDYAFGEAAMSVLRPLRVKAVGGAMSLGKALKELSARSTTYGMPVSFVYHGSASIVEPLPLLDASLRGETERRARVGAGMITVRPLSRPPHEGDVSRYLPRITMNVKDAPLDRVLDALFAAGKMRYRLWGGGANRITARLRDVPFEAALSIVLRAALGAHGYSVEWTTDGVLEIGGR